MKTDEADYKDRIFKCDHVEDGEEAQVFIWAGKHTRIELCRFCCTVALGTIASARLAEVFPEKYLIQSMDPLP